MMSYYYYYEKSSPLPVKDGIKVKKKKGDIGEQWWSKKFIESLQAMGMENRLTRGRTYARKGQVISLHIQDGVVQARVQGSSPRPYSVTIGIQKWNDKQWEKVFEEISSQALYSAQLLSGEMPPDIGDVISTAGLSLFPQKGKDLTTSCSCPDYANPCKHIAAVYYILAERFDADPFLIFSMRGKEKDQVLEELTQRRGIVEPDTPPSQSDSGSPLIPEVLTMEGFYSARSPLTEIQVFPGTQPPVKGLMMKRLDDSPFVVGKKNLSELLRPIYDAGPVFVRRMVHGDDSIKDEDESSGPE